MLFFISCLRLEIANHTVVLDSAVLPLTDQLVPQIRPFLAALSGMGVRHIDVGDDESRLWRIVLPALVERCRQWEHRSSCEYKAKAQIPLSIKHGQPFYVLVGLEGCHLGSFPVFQNGIWYRNTQFEPPLHRRSRSHSLNGSSRSVELRRQRIYSGIDVKIVSKDQVTA
jgi:hypothetical protein